LTSDHLNNAYDFVPIISRIRNVAPMLPVQGVAKSPRRAYVGIARLIWGLAGC
jgi:hypothetical protein